VTGDLFRRNTFVVSFSLAFFLAALLMACQGCAYQSASRSTKTEQLLGREVTEGRIEEGSIDPLTRDGGELPGEVRYRVQLLASTLREEAESLLEVASGLFSENVYLEYSEPYYKVRVGDFSGESEAEAVRNRANKLGFVDAWIVETVGIPDRNGNDGDE